MRRLSVLRRQAGITLVETLIALVVTAMGLLAVLGTQLRALTDNQTGVRRAQAIRLIEDLSERTRVNPHSLAQIGAYVSDWDHQPPATAAGNCADSACSPGQLAAFHLARWKASVSQVLPGGRAHVFIAEDEAGASDGNRRQLGVMIGWRENEASGNADYRKPLGLDSHDRRGNGAAACPDGRTCHLQYIPLSARCAPYFGDAAVEFFCAGQ